MKEKLNLTIEKNIKDRAKRLAKKRGVSVSRMVEEILKSISEPYEEWKPAKGSIVSELSGSIPAPNEIPYDDLLTEALMEKEGYEKNID